MHNILLPQNLMENILKDRKVRTSVVKQSHLMFFHVYFADYVKYETAPFQFELFQLTEKKDNSNLVIVAFRDSGKSTILTTSYPLWAILGEQQKKFVLILCQTRVQAKQHLMNIRRQLESNPVLKNDLGPFREESDEWGAGSLVFSRSHARISIASTEQSIRGLRHNQYRPDLIICDDVEDLASTRTKEGRDKAYQWLTHEVIPAGDNKEMRLVVVGNLLHEDSLIMRLKRDIEEKRFSGLFRAYPLLNEQDEIAWPGKFKNMDDIEILKRTVPSEAAFQREFMLRIVVDAERVIHPGWIQYYDRLPSPQGNDYKYTWVGVDLAISEKTNADYTAMVAARVFGYENNLRIYILPHPINEHLPFPETLERAKLMAHSVGDESPAKLFIESVGYQDALVQELEHQGYSAEGVRARGDKRARLALTSHLIRDGKILFPKQGCEALIQQMTGFGVEKHDDLVDAFTILVLKIMEDNKPMLRIYFI